MNVTVTISNIVNPSPALTTGEFLATIGNDYVQAGVSNLGTITLTAANQNCTITFSPGYVNRTSTMVFQIIPTNPIPATGYLQVQFPIVGYWQNDLAAFNQTFRLNSSMSCSSQSSVRIGLHAERTDIGGMQRQPQYQIGECHKFVFDFHKGPVQLFDGGPDLPSHPLTSGLPHDHQLLW